MVVMKFGGTSVADRDAVARLIAIVRSEPRSKVVVVSALSGVTDALTEILAAASDRDARRPALLLRELYDRHIALARATSSNRRTKLVLVELRRLFAELRALVRAACVLGHASPACRDAVLACGELASSRIVAAALTMSGLPAWWQDARRVVVTNDRHTKAVPIGGETKVRLDQFVRPRVERNRIVVLGGFIGATRGGATTTLGRGGSDYSAAIIGSALGADEIQIWTDVDGMLSADPRVVCSPQLRSHLSFDDASALAWFGAKVLHPATIDPARDSGIPVRILNSLRAPTEAAAPVDGHGTLITGETETPRPIAGFATKKNVSVTTLHRAPEASNESVLAQALRALERAGVGADLVTISDRGVSIAHDSSADRLLQEGLAAQAVVRSRASLAMVCAVGEGLRSGGGLSSRLLAALDGVPVVMMSQAGDRTMAFVIPEDAVGPAMARLLRVESQNGGVVHSPPTNGASSSAS